MLAAQKPKEFADALRLVHSIQPRIILEIGTKTGGSLCGWCHVIPKGATVISIDLPGGRGGGKYSKFDYEKELEPMLGDHEFHWIREDSQREETYQKVCDILKGRKIDFAFIDGGHKYNEVKSDFEMYGSLVNGLIMFHDIVSNFPRCQVHDFWEEIKEQYVHYEFVDPEWGRKNRMGIGAIFHKA